MRMIPRYLLGLFTILAAAWVLAAHQDIAPENILLLDHHGFRSEPAARPDPLLGFGLRPGVSLNGFSHNVHGFAGPEFAARKPAGVFRIFCLGGSTTLGAGVETDRFAYPAILQAMFDRATSRGAGHVEVVNAGVFGYHSLHTRLLATRRLDAYSPDLYLVMDGLNDLDAAKSLTLAQLRRLTGRDPGAGEAGYGLQAIAEKFALLDFAGNIQAAIDHAKSRSIGVVLVSDPLQADAAGRAPFAVRNQDFAALLAFGRSVLPEMNASLAGRNHIPYIDVQAALDPLLADPAQVRRVWADDLHLTRYGYYRLAREVFFGLMALPAVAEAAGRSLVSGPGELDGLFPELVRWRPPDGVGWPGAADALEAGVAARDNVAASKPTDGDFICLTPADPSRTGVIVLECPPGSAVRLYPRIQSATDKVGVYEVRPDGRLGLLFELRKTVEDGLWTPQAAWYDLRTTPGTTRLMIRLRGENAQIWGRGGAILFRPEKAGP